MKMKLWFWGLVVATAAWAFDAPSPALPATDAEALGLVGSVSDNIIKGDFWPVLGPLVVLAVWLFKKFDQDIPKVGPAISKFMDQPVVSFSLPFVFSAAGGLGTAMAAGLPAKQTLAIVMKVAMEATVLYVGGKKAAEQKNAGQAEAATVTDKASAVEELKKP